MEIKDFKKIFANEVKQYGFQKVPGGWYKASSECMIGLCLQRSNFGVYYQLFMNIFVQGLFGNVYLPTKYWIGSSVGDIMFCIPGKGKYVALFSFENTMDDDNRIALLKEFMEEYMTWFSRDTLTLQGIRKLMENGKLYVHPNVKAALEKMDGWNK